MLQSFQPYADLNFHCMMVTEIFFHAQYAGISKTSGLLPPLWFLLAVIILLYSHKFTTDDIN